MNRHLLPEEIDLLLDNEEGFGMAPLRQHLDGCPSCQERLDALARVVHALESLPHLHPAPLFADRLMTRVEVYQPWHVAARDFMGRLIPESSAGRVVMGGVGATALAGMTAGLLWIGQRADAVVFIGNFGLQKARVASASFVADVAQSVIGAGTADLIRGGDPLVLLGAAGALAIGVFGVGSVVKALARTANRRRG